MTRICLALLLSGGMAIASDGSTILEAKVRAGESGGADCVLHGAISMVASAEEFYLQDESSGVRVVSNPYQLREGQRLEVEGWMYVTDAGEFQVRSKQVWREAAGQGVAPRLITLRAALWGEYQGELVSIRGSVLNVDFGTRFDTISIQSGRNSVRVFYPRRPHELSAFEKIFPGMQVAVTGISVPQTVDPESDGYQVRLRRAGDLEIRTAPTTPERQPPLDLLRGLAIGLAGAALPSIRAWRRRRQPISSPNTRPETGPPAPFASS